MAIQEDKSRSSLALGREFVLDETTEVFVPAGERPQFEYADCGLTEQTVHSIVQSASDVADGSAELSRAIYDFPSRYHLSPERANLLRPLSGFLSGRILEVGAGCGAVTRYLGETAPEIWALEGSLRRAAIARARCRGLDNVSVISTNLEDFSPDSRFSTVTLIGVLEYARMYVKGGPAAMLRHCLRLLEPDGVLIIAIENQLGLKYFAGAPEDHMAIPFIGIEGRYGDDTQVTFGKEELTRLLNDAGYPAVNFLYPFPDYKFPRVVVPESAMGSYDVNIASVLRMNAAELRPFGLTPFFSEELVWPRLLQNGLAGDLANSFLVIASPGTERLQTFDPPVWAYNGARRSLAKSVHFRPEGETVVREYLHPGEPDSEALSKFEHHLSTEPLYRGPLLGDRFIDVLNTPGWTEEQIAQCAMPWVDYLITRQLNFDEGMLPGALVDCTPFNLACLSDGTLRAFDLEWIAKEPIPLAFVLFRGLLVIFSRAKSVAQPGPIKSHSIADLISAAMAILGFPQTDDGLASLISLEADLYDFVFGPGHMFTRDFAHMNLPAIRSHDIRVDLTRVSSELAAVGSHRAELEGALQQLQQDYGHLEQAHRDAEDRCVQLDSRLVSEKIQKEAQEQQLLAEREQWRSRLRDTETVAAQLKAELSNSESGRAQLEFRLYDAVLESEEATSELERTSAELSRILSSRSWRIISTINNAAAKAARFAHVRPSPAQLVRSALTFRLPQRLSIERRKKLLTDSGLFDKDFYLERNPDVAAAGVDPVEHFIVDGGLEGRNPHPLFLSDWYLRQNTDVAAANVNPLIHYLRCGGFEGRDPHPMFSSRWYLRQNPDVAAARVNPLSHYLKKGALEGRNPHPDFDGASYLAQNPDVALKGLNPLVHYTQFGSPPAGFQSPSAHP